MSQDWNRRDFLGLLGVGGLVFASGLPACSKGGAPASPFPARRDDFFFLQLSDTHWGYQGPANPEAGTTLEHAVATINASPMVPDFIVFTGDLTHTTDDGRERRERMKRFREIASTLKVKDVRFLAGEHDASPDRGEAFREIFGEPTYAFDHKGVHFVALDNASMPGGAMGEAQLSWLARELSRVPPDVPVIVLAHRPLFPLFPDWEWATRDGSRALEILGSRDDLTVFYGHIHQEHHFTTGHIAHHAARSLIFPMPAPGSLPKRAPLAWDATNPDHGLGWRKVALGAPAARVTEVPYS
jgi:hypothetical protein